MTGAGYSVSTVEDFAFVMIVSVGIKKGPVRVPGVHSSGLSRGR
jgi:hypothetical protein